MIRCGLWRVTKEGEGGPGNGPLAPVDVWRGQDVHVDVAGRGRKRLPQGIAVPPSVHKAEDCPPGEHRHDRFDYCHPEKRKHRGMGKPKEKRPFPPSRTIVQASQKAFRAYYHALGAEHEGDRDKLYERYRQLRELAGMAREWERSPEGVAWTSREKVKRAKGQGQKSREHYEAKAAALQEKYDQLKERHEVLWEKYRTPGGSAARQEYYSELAENTKQMKAARAGLKRAKSLATLGFAREWTNIIKEIAGGVEPQISAIRTGSRQFAHYSLDSGIIGLSDHALEILEKVRNDPDLLWKSGPNLRPDRAAFAVSALVHEFMHSVNPAKDAYVRGGISGMIEEGLTEAIANRMVARADVLSKLLGTEVEQGIVAKPDTAMYKVYTDTMEYMAELAAKVSNSEPEWFLGKWKFHTDPKTRGETILDDATGVTTDETGLDVLEVRNRSRAAWRNFIDEAQENLPEMKEAREAGRAERAFKGAVRTVRNNLWRIAGFEFKASGYPMGGPAGGRGQNFDMRHSGSETPPRGVGWEKFPRQGGESVGGTGAGAVEAMEEKARTYVESPADAPEGTQTQRGPRGGIYYETAGDEERESGVFYHGTNQQAAALMERQGFGTAERIGGMAPAAAPEERGLTFLTPSKRAAHWFAHENFRAPEFGGPSVIKVGFDGRVLRIPKAKSIYEAARALDVRRHPQRGYDFKDFRKKMAESGYDAVAFSDKSAGGREALAVFNTESLRVVGKPGRRVGRRVL